MKTVIRQCVCICVALFLLLALVPSVSAEISVVGALSRNMLLAPGEEAQGRIIVRNKSSRARVVRAILTDYRSLADGTTHYGEAGRLDRSNAPWLHILPREQSIPGNSSAFFTFIVRVPRDQSLAGTYWSMLMVEPVSAAALEPPDDRGRKPRLSIRTTVRTGILLVTHIRGTGQADVRFQKQVLEGTPGRIWLRFDLENTGELYLNLAVWVELFDEKGVSIGRFDAPRQSLFPDNSTRVRVPLSGVPSGAYVALIIADDGGDAVFGARHEIVIP